MGTLVLTDASVTVAGTDLSDHVQSVTLNYSADEVEDTNMGDDTHVFMAGTLKNWSLEVEFSQDYAASEVDATLFSAVGTSVALVVKPTSAAVSSTNPSFSGNGILTSYNPVGGSVGEKSVASATFQPAGSLTRATS